MNPENKSTIRKKIAIISYGNCANLGDRIGQSIILRMIPYDCSVDFLYLPPFWNNKYENNIYDLVIIGTGHSVFFKTLNDKNFIKFLDKQKNTIGVFGLQYHDLLDKSIFNDFTKKFTHIFVRNEKDLTYFNDKKINIKPGIVDNLQDGLSIVKKIQSYRVVESFRLHPLLAGLQSCDEFIFHEQTEMGNKIKSNKFSNMLYDIFKEDFKPGVQYKVDKDLVLKYRKFVFDNLLIIQDKIKEFL